MQELLPSLPAFRRIIDTLALLDMLACFARVGGQATCAVPGTLLQGPGIAAACASPAALRDLLSTWPPWAGANRCSYSSSVLAAAHSFVGAFEGPCDMSSHIYEPLSQSQH